MKQRSSSSAPVKSSIREVDFRKDNRLIGGASTATFAANTAKIDHLSFKGTQVYLGLVRSSEYTSRGRRREASKEFWMAYFRFCGGHPKFVADGPGLMTNLLSPPSVD